MKKAYFIEQNDEITGDNIIALLITDEPFDDLVRKDIIKSDSRYLVTTEDQFMREYDSKYKKLFDNQNYLKFDENKNFVWKTEAIRTNFFHRLRLERDRQLSILDNLSIRSFLQNFLNILEEIKQDQQTLRDLPAKYENETFEEPFDISKKWPPELDVDYDFKYNQKFINESENINNTKLDINIDKN